MCRARHAFNVILFSTPCAVPSALFSSLFFVGEMMIFYFVPRGETLPLCSCSNVLICISAFLVVLGGPQLFVAYSELSFCCKYFVKRKILLWNIYMRGGSLYRYDSALWLLTFLGGNLKNIFLKLLVSPQNFHLVTFLLNIYNNKIHAQVKHFVWFKARARDRRLCWSFF